MDLSQMAVLVYKLDSTTYIIRIICGYICSERTAVTLTNNSIQALISINLADTCRLYHSINAMVIETVFSQNLQSSWKTRGWT